MFTTNLTSQGFRCSKFSPCLLVLDNVMPDALAKHTFGKLEWLLHRQAENLWETIQTGSQKQHSLPSQGYVQLTDRQGNTLQVSGQSISSSALNPSRWRSIPAISDICDHPLNPDLLLQERDSGCEDHSVAKCCCWRPACATCRLRSSTGHCSRARWPPTSICLGRMASVAAQVSRAFVLGR